MYRLVQRRGIIGLFCLLFVASSVVPGWAQKDNRFEVSKNRDIFNSLLKEVEMFYVDSVDVDKLEFSPMVMQPVSARSTAPSQTLLFFSSRTLPAIVAFSAAKAAP
mgnify:CR=1 FL=1